MERAPAAPASGGCVGVGIDLAERSALAHLPDASVRRAASRWLTDGERR